MSIIVSGRFSCGFHAGFHALPILAEMWNPDMVTFERCSNHTAHQFVIKRHFPIFESSEGTLMVSHDGESAAYTMLKPFGGFKHVSCLPHIWGNDPI